MYAQMRLVTIARDRQVLPNNKKSMMAVPMLVMEKNGLRAKTKLVIFSEI